MQPRERCAGNGQGHAASDRGAAEHGGAGSGDRGGEVHRPHRHAGIYGQRTGGRFSAPPAAMIPVLPPAALGQEIAACTVLGASIGALRAVFPARGRAAFVPDLVWMGAVLAAAQSYAAGQSSAGVLRWYMAAAAFAGAGAAAFVLGAPLRAAGGVLQRRVLRPAERRRARRRKARKLRRSAKRTAKKRKKNLPNQRRMMYSSYVLK